MTDGAIQALVPLVGTRAACAAAGCPRATYYRRCRPPRRPRAPQPRALTPVERAEVCTLLHSPRFVDQAPPTIYATLLDDEQRYLCSVSTMYRLLRAEGEVHERRRQAGLVSWGRRAKTLSRSP